MRILCFAAASLFSFAVSTAVDAQSCGAGQGEAEARVSFPTAARNLSSVTQYAWDEAGGLIEVCDLTGTRSNLAFWILYTGEVSASHPGICLGIITTSGQQQFSCAAGRSVRIAFGAPLDQGASLIRFDTWHATLRAD